MQALANLIRSLFWGLTALIVIVFSVTNRKPFLVDLWPFEINLAIMPYHLLFLGIFIGFVITGSVMSWLRLQEFTRRRKAERRAHDRTQQMQAMAEDTEAREHAAATAIVASATKDDHLD